MAKKGTAAAVEEAGDEGEDAGVPTGDGGGARPDFSGGEEALLHTEGEGEGEGDGGEGEGAPAAGAPAAAAAAAEPEGEDGRPAPKDVPYSRFADVNGKLRDTAEALARSQGELDAYRRQAQPTAATPAAAAAAAPVDIAALEAEIYDATLEGEKEKVVALRAQVNAELERRADVRAEAREAARQRTSAEADMAEAQNTALEKYPFLDVNSPDADVAAIGAVVAQRDAYMAKGMRAGAALEKAVERVAPRFAPASAAAPPVDDLGQQRQRKALDVAAAASRAQPSKLDVGIGARAPGGTGASLETMSDEQLAKVPRRELLA